MLVSTFAVTSTSTKANGGVSSCTQRLERASLDVADLAVSYLLAPIRENTNRHRPLRSAVEGVTGGAEMFRVTDTKSALQNLLVSGWSLL